MEVVGPQHCRVQNTTKLITRKFCVMGILPKLRKQIIKHMRALVYPRDKTVSGR